MSNPKLIYFIVLILCASASEASFGCVPFRKCFNINRRIICSHNNSDTIPGYPAQFSLFQDTAKTIIRSGKDTFSNDLKKQVDQKKSNFLNFFSRKRSLNINDSPGISFNKELNQFRLGATKPPSVSVQSGVVAYNFNYRSIIDTPFSEKNVAQHIVTGQLNMQVASVPLRANFLLRRSSSPYFTDINNIQVEYDGQRFKSDLKNRLSQKLTALGKQLKDTLLEIDYKLKLKEFARLEKNINAPLRFQKFLESKEILNLPEQQNGETDSATVANLKTLKQEARIFTSEYEQQEKEFASFKAKKDSTAAKYNAMLEKIQKWQDFVKNKSSAIKSREKLKEAVSQFGISDVELPKKYYFLNNIRRAGVGRNMVNYSELTSKNLSTTGINFEYNSWYYFSVTAGTVDFRFRDFAINKFKRTPQFMYMLRLGIGRVEKNYFIISAYQGKKQLFVSSDNSGGVQSIPVKGLAAEVRIKLHSTTYIKAEIAQSLSQDFRKNPAVNMKLGLKDQSNLAYTAKLYSYFPATRSRLEASYRYTGANFQSFSTFQTNASVKAWQVKADQSFLKRRLNLSASIKANDFYNDFIAQRYESNTVFKSVQASIRIKGLPFVTAGYIPVSQLTYVDSILTENHFQSLHVSLVHNYLIGNWKGNLSTVYSRFYNNPSDTSIAYYNAENVFVTNMLDMNFYTFKLAVSTSNSSSFKLLVLDAGLDFKVKNKGSFGFGFKGNNFNKKTAGTGVYVNMNYNIRNIGMLALTYEKGYLPANNYRFMRNDIMNINFTRRFVNRK